MKHLLSFLLVVALISSGQQFAAAAAAAVPNPHASDWYNEKQRPKSPMLQVYENAIEPIDLKIALANVLATCGIRGQEWHRKMLAVLDERRHQSSIEEIRQRLSPRDVASAKRFDQIVIDGETQFHLGGEPKEAACRSEAKMPFVLNDMAFKP